MQQLVGGSNNTFSSSWVAQLSPGFGFICSETVGDGGISTFSVWPLECGWFVVRKPLWMWWKWLGMRMNILHNFMVRLSLKVSVWMVLLQEKWEKRIKTAIFHKSYEKLPIKSFLQWINPLVLWKLIETNIYISLFMLSRLLGSRRILIVAWRFSRVKSDLKICFAFVSGLIYEVDSFL